MYKLKNYLKDLNVAYIDKTEYTRNTKELLEIFFHSLDIYNDPKDFLVSPKINCYDLVISEIFMTNYNGIDLIKIIRTKNKKIAVILLTANSNNEYLLELVNLNIQSYIKKPINLKKLTKALKNIVFFLDITNNLKYHINDFIFDMNSLKLTKNNTEVLLTKKEKNFLYLLILNLGKPISYDEIEKKVWLTDNQTMSQNALRTIVKTLKRKLDNTSIIKNISTFGYKIDIP